MIFEKSMHRKIQKTEICTNCTRFEFRTSEAIFLNCAPNWSFNDVYRRILIARSQPHTKSISLSICGCRWVCVFVTRRTRHYTYCDMVLFHLNYRSLPHRATPQIHCTQRCSGKCVRANRIYLAPYFIAWTIRFGWTAGSAII